MQLYHEVIERLRIESPTDPDRLEAVAELVHIFLDERNYHAAAKLTREFHDLQAVNMTGRAAVVATTMNTLGCLFTKAGRLVDAAPLFRSALAISRAGVGSTNEVYGDSLINLASVFTALKDYGAAEPLLTEAVDVFREAVGTDHSKYATALHNLALVYRWTLNIHKSAPLYRESLDITRRTLGSDHPHYAQTLDNLANVYRALDDYSQAELLYQESIEIRRRALSEGHPDLAAGLSNLAVCLHEMGRIDEAEPLHRLALRIRRTAFGNEHPDTVTSLNNLAVVLGARGQVVEAFALAREAIMAEDGIVGQMFMVASEEQRMKYMDAVRQHLDGFLSICRLPGVGIEGIHAALDSVLRRKALAAEALIAQRETVLGGKYPALWSQLEELTRLRRSIAEATLSYSDRDTMAEGRLQAAIASRVKLEADLARQIPEVALDKQLRAAQRQMVAAALPAGSVLVEFVRHRPFDFNALMGRPWLPDRYLAFVLPAGYPDEVKMIDLGESTEIDRAVAAYRGTVTGFGKRPNRDIYGHLASASATADEEAEGRRLRATVFDPLVPGFRGRARLFLSPDGDLTRLPFEILPVATLRERLIDRYEISYLSTNTVYLVLR